MDSVSLYLSDILKKVEESGIEDFSIKKAWLILHSEGRAERCKKDLREEKDDCYTAVQGENFANGRKHLIVFVSDRGQKKARLVACYKMNGEKIPVASKFVDIPDMPEDCKKPTLYFYTIEKSQILEDFEERLVIDWGGGTRNFKHGADVEKRVLSINSKTEEPFPGYENLILPYNKLEEIVENAEEYETWRDKLSDIYAVYLIVDKETGEKYIGSAYGEDGLLGRWSCYVKTKHGGNAGMKEHICDYPERYEYFQFSILQALSKSPNNEKKVIEYENLYKDKLLTRGEFGLNRN